MPGRAIARAAGSVLACVLLGAGPAGAQEKDLDTPYVQTPQVVVDKMLEIARVGPGDFVIDLGSGDGRMVITAASRYGARGFGVDLDRRLVALANRNAAKAGVQKRVVFHERDLFVTDVSAATVLTLYLLPDVNLAIRDRLLATLKPGTRIVSHDYHFGEWPPDLELEMPAPGKTVGAKAVSKVFYWVVPGNAAGKWHWRLVREGKPVTWELSIEQNFQKLEGALTAAGQPAKVENLLLRGAEIAFTAVAAGVRHDYTGRIYNNAIAGSVRAIPTGKSGGEAVLTWEATRTELRDPRHVARRGR